MWRKRVDMKRRSHGFFSKDWKQTLGKQQGRHMELNLTKRAPRKTSNGNGPTFQSSTTKKIEQLGFAKSPSNCFALEFICPSFEGLIERISLTPSHNSEWLCNTGHQNHSNIFFLKISNNYLLTNNAISYSNILFWIICFSIGAGSCLS